MRYNDEVCVVKYLHFTAAHYLFVSWTISISYELPSCFDLSHFPLAIGSSGPYIFRVRTQCNNLYNSSDTRITSSQVMQPKYISWLYIVRYVSEIYA